MLKKDGANFSAMSSPLLPNYKPHAIELRFQGRPHRILHLLLRVSDVNKIVHDTSCMA
jgi:hypothetical protein